MADYGKYKLSRKEWLIFGFIYVLLDIAAALLFYNSFIAALILAPVFIVYIKFVKRRLVHKRAKILKLQFREMMISLYSMIASGCALETALKGTVSELRLCYGEDAYIMKEMSAIASKLEMNYTAEACLYDFALRSHDADILSFYEIVCAAKKNGGSMPQVIKTAIDRINEKIETECEIATMIAARKNEFMIMLCIPAGIIAYMRLGSASMMNVLYTQLSGRIIMSICLAAYGASALWGQKILNIRM